MADEDWDKGLLTLGIRLAGDAIEEMDGLGNPIIDDSFLLLLNAHHEAVPFTLPAHKKGVAWQWMFDTAKTDRKAVPKTWRGGKVYDLEARATALMRLRDLKQVSKNSKLIATGWFLEIDLDELPTGSPRYLSYMGPRIG